MKLKSFLSDASNFGAKSFEALVNDSIPRKLSFQRLDSGPAWIRILPLSTPAPRSEPLELAADDGNLNPLIGVRYVLAF